jgi:hypothetical protein
MRGELLAVAQQKLRQQRLRAVLRGALEQGRQIVAQQIVLVQAHQQKIPQRIARALQKKRQQHPLFG